MNRMYLIAAVIAALAITSCQAQCSGDYMNEVNKCGKDVQNYMQKASSHEDELQIVCCLAHWATDCMVDSIKKNCPGYDMDQIKGLLNNLRTLTGGMGGACPDNLDKESCKHYLKKVGAGASNLAVPTVLSTFLVLLTLFFK